MHTARWVALVESKRSAEKGTVRQSRSRRSFLALRAEQEGSANSDGCSNPRCLDGKVAFITGDSERISLHLADAFARAGADIATSMAQMSPESVGPIDLGGSSRVRVHDVVGKMTCEPEIAASVNGVINSLGTIDVLVYAAEDSPFNSPYMVGHGLNSPEITENRLDRMSGVCQAVLPHMADRGTGSIIIITAPTRTRPWPDIASQSARFVALELVKLLSQTWSPYGVRVNAICPGRIGPLVSARANGHGRSPDHRPVRAVPESALDGVIAAASWLASDASRCVKGAHLALGDHYAPAVFSR